MSKIFGLDFGTSNSLLSVNDNGQIKMLNIDPSNSFTSILKLVLYFSEDKKNLVLDKKQLICI